MDPLDIYQDEVKVDVKSMICGKYTKTESLTELCKNKKKIPKVLIEWAKDNDLQYLKICSTNIGFIHEYSKQYKKSEKPALGSIKDI
jgi:hypothetical protein